MVVSGSLKQTSSDKIITCSLCLGFDFYLLWLLLRHAYRQHGSAPWFSLMSLLHKTCMLWLNLRDLVCYPYFTWLQNCTLYKGYIYRNISIKFSVNIRDVIDHHWRKKKRMSLLLQCNCSMTCVCVQPIKWSIFNHSLYCQGLFHWNRKSKGR